MNLLLSSVLLGMMQAFEHGVTVIDRKYRMYLLGSFHFWHFHQIMDFLNIFVLTKYNK